MIPPLAGCRSYTGNHFFSHEVLFTKGSNNLAMPLMPAKRAFDFCAGSAGLLPFRRRAGVCRLADRCGVGGVFFAMVVGMNGKLFKCWKFRTMVRLKEVLEQLLRPTRRRAPGVMILSSERPAHHQNLGAFLRKTKARRNSAAMECFARRMSLVGPRLIIEA